MAFDLHEKVEKPYIEAYNRVAHEIESCRMHVNFARNKIPSLTILPERSAPWQALELQHQKYGFTYLPDYDTFVLSSEFLKLDEKEKELVLNELASYSFLMHALGEEVEFYQEIVRMLPGAAFIEALTLQNKQGNQQAVPFLQIYNLVSLFPDSISKIDASFSTVSSYQSFENARINPADYSYILKTLRSAGIQDRNQQFFLTISILASADLLQEEDFYKQYVNVGYQLAKRLNPRENTFGQLVELIRHANSESEFGVGISRSNTKKELNEYGNSVADLLDKMKNLCSLDFDYILPIAGIISGKSEVGLTVEEEAASGAIYYNRLCNIAQATGEIKGELEQLLRRP
ncbi:MAG: hypothetical protein ACP5TJ_00325 [Candidatus Micrarchaeia archaeon]